MSNLFKLITGLFLAKGTIDFFKNSSVNKQEDQFYHHNNDNIDYHECEMDENGYEGEWDDD